MEPGRELQSVLSRGFENSKRINNSVFFPYVGMRIYPGTKLHDEAVENGWVEKDLKWEQTTSKNTKPLMRTPDLTRDEILELLSESYRSFYLDKKFHFRKYLSFDHGPIRSNPNFRWTWRYFLKFFTKGITKFMLKLNEIVDDIYEVTEEVTETELSLDY